MGAGAVNPEGDALVAAAADGDLRAMGELFGRFRDRLRVMVRLRMDRRLQGRVDPSDVLQEAFLEASQRIADFAQKKPMPFFLWLRFLTAQRLLIVHRRHLGAKMRDAGGEVSIYRGAMPEATSVSLAAQLLGRLTSPADLHPSSVYFASTASGAGGGQQVGTASRNPTGGGTGVITHAFLWRPGFAPLNLHPAAASVSSAFGTDGVNQVGGAWFGNDSHAVMWRGTAASYVDLTPTHLGFTDARAHGIHGGRQVGEASRNSEPNRSHAVLWSGTADSAVVLLPPEGFTSATAHAIHGGEQVGQAFNAGQRGRHAVVWHDDPDSAVDLHPAGFDESDALDTNGSQQVGVAYHITGFPDTRRAAVWSGSAGTFVNLHDFLPAGYRQSAAAGIDGEGNVYGIAITTEGVAHQIVWRPVPEPSGVFIMGAAIMTGLLRRRR
ncbi:MAG TPA: PEP-CTERM sorting domain-containing protein [Tepidisphaeraceae bacterium]|nr:PEP-CTERM sorting domain-containing protein [Tepidisphaeraceae bacterium]